MPRRTPYRLSKRHERIFQEYAPVTPDWKYWVEHVVHWHAALMAIIAVLTVGYVFFSQQSVMAHSYEQFIHN